MKKLLLLLSVIFMSNMKVYSEQASSKNSSKIFESSVRVAIPVSILVAGFNTVRSLPRIIKSLPKKSLFMSTMTMVLAQQLLGSERNIYVSFDSEVIQEVVEEVIESNGVQNLVKDIIELPENFTVLVDATCDYIGEKTNLSTMLDNFNDNVQERKEESDIVGNYL